MLISGMHACIESLLYMVLFCIYIHASPTPGPLPICMNYGRRAVSVQIRPLSTVLAND